MVNHLRKCLKMTEAWANGFRINFVRSPSISTWKNAWQFSAQTSANAFLRIIVKSQKSIVATRNGQRWQRQIHTLTWRSFGSFEKNSFTPPPFFFCEATFHLSGHVNRHTVRIWGSNNPHAVFEDTRYRRNFHFLCDLSSRNCSGLSL